MGSRSLQKGRDMILNEENLANYRRQLDIIGEIPSNKFDVPDFSALSDGDMDEFERRHLNELAEQTRNYDVREQMIVAENLDPFICFNAVGKWMDTTRGQLQQATTIFQPQEESNG